MACSIERFTLFLCIFLFSYNYVKSQQPYSDFERSFTRKLGTLKVNPGCNMDWCLNSSYTGGLLTYTVATGPKDELHHLFCTIGAPTLMISRTIPGTELMINYTSIARFNGSEALNYTNAPDHSFGMIFPNLYEYDDFNDTANMSDYRGNKSANHRHLLTDLSWSIFNKSGDDTHQTIIVNATAPGSSHTLFKKNGYLSFIIRYDSKDGRLTSRPHMEYTANSSMVTVVMENLTTMYPNSRFAVEMVMFSTENSTEDPAQTWNATQVKLDESLDDEYSPGVFQMRNWFANLNKHREQAWGYAQWKPVVYTKQERLNADLSTATSYPNLAKDKPYILNHTLPSKSLFTFYFNIDHSDVSLNATNVSFGITNDKFFDHTKYLVWTMSMGMGPAPEDDVSTLVILVIAVGLGIPLVLMIFSAVFVCVKNIKKRKSQAMYTPINE